jgi:hypothetical protein
MSDIHERGQSRRALHSIATDETQQHYANLVSWRKLYACEREALRQADHALLFLLDKAFAM